MKKNTTTKQPLEANYVQWFMNKPVEERIILSNKYYPESHRNDLEDEEILEIYLAENNIHPTPDSKEGLHTQGEWYVSSVLQTDKNMCPVPYHEISVKEGNKSSWWLAQVNASENAFDLEESKANAELIVKAVNERQALLDSRAALAKALQDMIGIVEWYGSNEFAPALNKGEITRLLAAKQVLKDAGLTDK